MIPQIKSTCYHKVEIDNLLNELKVDSKSGLSDDEVSLRQQVYGLNKLEEEAKPHIVLRYLEQFKDPLILLLLGSATLSVLVRQYDDAISIAAAVIIVGSVAFFQELKSEETLEALRTLIPLQCNVLRNGAIVNIIAEELVPGDIITFRTGDRVPADCRILTCTSLYADESSLTGESEPSEKSSKSLSHLAEDISTSDKHNMLFMGTLITSGNATAVVIATATQTEFGKTFQEVKDMDNNRTPLQLKMDELGNKLSMFSIGIIACIAILGMIQGKSFLSMFNIGVSLAVAAIPEGLPICVTVTLALGVMRMAKRKAIVKKLPAVEALGCANFICCDKTGTLTQNKMVVRRIYCPALEDSFYLNDIHRRRDDNSSNNNNNNNNYETVFNPYDVFATANQITDSNHSSSSNLFTSSSNGQEEYNREYIVYNGHSIVLSKFPCLEQLLIASCLCNNAHYTSQTTHVGQPTEFALIACARQLGVIDRRSTYKRLEEMAFSSETKVMEVLYENDQGQLIYYIKGALETILPRCTSYVALNNELMNFSKPAQERVLQHSVEMASDGLRVLAIACGKSKHDLTFCGIVGLMDPLRPGILEAVHRIQTTGAKVMMITGDSEETATSIAKLAGIYDPTLIRSSRILSGREIEELSRTGEDVLASLIEDVSICYRTSPRHKLSIVRALQSKGNCVAMTGDGVNDSPALKAADIGIAVGSGSDCAKEAAAMIIIDDDFSTIVNAIEEGKSIFYNIKNFLTFQLSTSFAALSLVAVNNILGRQNPLNAMQILWINIIMDGPLAQSLGVEVVDPTVMQRPPRNKDDDIITKPLLSRVITSGLLILCGTMFMFLQEDGDEDTISAKHLTMTFTTFIMFDMFNAYVCRHNTKPVYEIPAVSNQAFLLALSFSLFGQILVVYFPPLQKVFKTTSLSLYDILIIICLSSTMLILDSIRKIYFPHIFTEVIPGKTYDAKMGKKTEAGNKDETFMV